jgi:O-antigen/teichoic acid export membrane protein
LDTPESPDLNATDAALTDELSPREVARRTVTGSMFNVASQGITLFTGFTRSVLLARLLLPADVGIVALALFYVNLITSIATFG